MHTSMGHPELVSSRWSWQPAPRHSRDSSRSPQLQSSTQPFVVTFPRTLLPWDLPAVAVPVKPDLIPGTFSNINSWPSRLLHFCSVPGIYLPRKPLLCQPMRLKKVGTGLKRPPWTGTDPLWGHLPAHCYLCPSATVHGCAYSRTGPALVCWGIFFNCAWKFMPVTLIFLFTPINT